MAEIARDVDLSKLEGQPTQRAEPLAQRENIEIATDIDLSKLEGRPTARADAQIQLENSELEMVVPGGTSVKSSGTTYPDSPQAVGHTVLVMAVAGCLGALGAAITLPPGAPVWLPVTILVGLPPAFFLLVRFVYWKWSPR